MSRLAANYASRLAGAYLLSITAAVAILIPLGGEALTGAQNYFTRSNIIGSAVLVVIGTLVIGVGGVLNISPTLKWFNHGLEPDERQRKGLTRLLARQSALLAGTWIVSGAISILLNFGGGIGIVVATAFGVVLGGSAATGVGLLLTMELIRPMLAAATHASERLVAAPSVFARLILLWLLCSALPCLVIAALVVVRANGWLIPKTASVEIAALVVALAAFLLGLPTMILTSRSISDPIGEVVDGMAAVEKGDFDTEVAVFERSEIGRLQSGFNRMVAGLAERERVRDLFGRHVGANVARRAIEEGASMSGDVEEAAILFIDLTGSTELAASYPPEKVAEVLNDFFRIVVNAVDARRRDDQQVPGRCRARRVRGAVSQRRRGFGGAGDGAHPRRAVAGAAAGRLRDRRLGRLGLRGQHRRREPLRVHGDRGPGERGRAAGGSREGVGSTDPVLVCGDRAGR